MNEIFKKLMQINRITFSQPFFKLINMANFLRKVSFKLDNF